MLLPQLAAASNADTQKERQSVLMHLERFVNDGSPSGYSEGPHQVAEPFRPSAPVRSFELPLFRVEATECIGVGVAPTEGFRFDPSPEYRVVPVHPDIDRHTVISAGGVPHGFLEVAATSSSRTVAVIGADHHLKLHYPGLVGRAPRELPLRRVSRSVAVSSALDEAIASPAARAGVDFLREPVGQVWTSGEVEIGAILRETGPLRPRSAGGIVLPWFAMASVDRLAPTDAPLLVQLVQSSDSMPTTVEKVIEPVLNAFLWLALAQGLIPEAHGQNLLVEVSNEGRVVRVIFRDLLDFVVDDTIRESMGRSFVEGARTFSDPHDLLGRWRSWAFDFKLSEYALLPVMQCIARAHHVPLGAVQVECKRHVLKLFAEFGWDASAYFSRGDEVSYIGQEVPAWGDAPHFLTRRGALLR